MKRPLAVLTAVLFSTRVALHAEQPRERFIGVFDEAGKPVAVSTSVEEFERSFPDRLSKQEKKDALSDYKKAKKKLRDELRDGLKALKNLSEEQRREEYSRLQGRLASQMEELSRLEAKARDELRDEAEKNKKPAKS